MKDAPVHSVLNNMVVLMANRTSGISMQKPGDFNFYIPRYLFDLFRDELKEYFNDLTCFTNTINGVIRFREHRILPGYENKIIFAFDQFVELNVDKWKIEATFDKKTNQRTMVIS